MCGTFRRRAMDYAAKDIGADLIATGHNLDDTLQTFVINMLSGDTTKVGWMNPDTSKNSLRKIKPFCAPELNTQNTTKTYMSAKTCQVSAILFLIDPTPVPLIKLENCSFDCRTTIDTMPLIIAAKTISIASRWSKF